jgi:uncharacterized protein YbaR (Trm112 family)
MSLIDPGLLQILCCPETHQPIAEADAALLSEVNNRIAGGALKNRAGQILTEKLDGGLLRQDCQVLYPIRNRIPILLIDEAIPLA